MNITRGRNGYPTPRPTPKRARSASSTRWGGAFSVPGYSGQLFYEAGRSASASTGSAISASTVKSGGFISSSALARTRSKEAKYNRAGVSITHELGGVVDAGLSSATAGNTVAVGHANVAANTAHLMMWRAIIKALLIHQGHNDLSNFEAVLPGVATGDLIRCRYRLTVDGVYTNRDFALTAGVSTPNQMATSFATFFYNAGTDLEFQFIEYRPDSTAATVNAFTQLTLKMCRVHFMGKSTLKIQNRTVNATGGDEESVDNVPLYGRVYGGNGNGTEAKTQDSQFPTAAMTFRGDEFYGAIAKVPSERWYQEIPEPSLFTSVKNFGKVNLDPGQVKTSTLTFESSFALNKIYKSNFNVIGDSHPKCLFGKYRFMLLEKMINASTPSATNSIKIAYEVNNRIACYVTIVKDTTTAMLNNLSNFTAEV